MATDKGTNASVKNYLVAYNVFAFSFWLVYFTSFLCSGLVLNERNLFLLNMAQGLAVLEIVHTVLKWVKSPVASTVAQVSSRLLVLVLINIFKGDAQLTSLTTIGVITVSIAWSVTEIVRYSFYAAQLLNSLPPWLLWMRYTFFIVLYPMGVTGEWLIIGSPVIEKGFALNAYNLFVVFLLVSYVYYFPVLYRYMWKQRKARV